MDALFNYLPIFVLLMGFLAVLAIFIFGIFILLKSGGNVLEKQRARNFILKSFYWLIAVCASALVFFLVTYLIKKGEVFLPPQASGDFPAAPISGALPPQPEFFNVDGYYFSAPLVIKSMSVVPGPAFFAVLCKTGERYGIIQVGSANKGNQAQLAINDNYKYWLSACQDNVDNIFISVFSFSSQSYQAGNFDKMGAILKDKMVSPCLGN